MSWEEDFIRVFGEAPPAWFIQTMQAEGITAPPGVPLDQWLIQKYGEQYASEREQAEVLAQAMRETGLYTEQYIQARILGPTSPVQAQQVQTIVAKGTVDYDQYDIDQAAKGKASPPFIVEQRTQETQYNLIGPQTNPLTGGAEGGNGTDEGLGIVILLGIAALGLG
jgi:hypothetical protein